MARAALEPPLRVLVKGPSVVGVLGTMNGPPSDYGFPRALEATLLASGRPAQVRAETEASELARSSLRTWERQVAGWSPDVVVLAYGYMETMHLLLPRWLERHANSFKAVPRWWSELYRKYFLRKLWMALARTQAKLDGLVSPTFRRSRPRRVAADLERLIGHLRMYGSPLILVFELLPPGSRYRSWFPGMTARVEVMNEALRTLVDRAASPDVRLVELSPLVERYCGGDTDVALPDGFHYSVELHRAIGTELAAVIAEWYDASPRFTPDTSDPRLA